VNFLTSNLQLLIFASAMLFASSATAQTRPWMDPSLAPQKRAELLLSNMTLEQKFQQMVGEPGIVPELPQCLGGRHVPGLPRLGIPTLRITNGPVGVGQNDCVPADMVTNSGPGASMMSPHSAKATALPSAMTIAASFDRKIASRFGDVLGRESRNLALHVMEAPGINLARTPQGGRNFEYFGEDPFLAGTMAVAEIRAIQSHGVIAMPKHYVANDQETDRKRVDARVEDRVLHQLYLLPFEMTVKDADVAAIMCSYNSVNGVQMCENKHLLTGVLRGQWGFKGYVQSDFFATQSLSALRAGMDHEMPGYRLDVKGMLTWYTPQNLKAALAKGEIVEADIDTALSRRYLQMFRLGIFDRPVEQSPIDVRGNGAIAADIGQQGAVLLKNENGLLPLIARSVRRVALIGKGDYAQHAVAGRGGSAQVIPFYTVPPLEGFKKTLAELGSKAQVSLIVVGDDNSNLKDAVDAARAADAVVVLAGALSVEGQDQSDINLPHDQNAMIAAIAAANPRTVVVLRNNASIVMPWIDAVPAVLETWYPGQEDGTIISRLIFGLANPSGKTPVTYPRTAEEVPIRHVKQFPGVLENEVRRVEYSEGLEMGYRWYDAKGVKPLFPFGYGLSYTRFELSDFSINAGAIAGKQPIRVKFAIRNVGKIDGAEVSQVYVRFPASAGEPPKRLVGFEKVWLKPGERRQVEITIDPSASNHPFETFDTRTQQWITPGGRFVLMVGTSSADVGFSQEIGLAP